MRSYPTRKLTILYQRSIAVVIDIPIIRSPTLARLPGLKEEEEEELEEQAGRRSSSLPFPGRNNPAALAPHPRTTTSAPSTPTTTALHARYHEAG